MFQKRHMEALAKVMQELGNHATNPAMESQHQATIRLVTNMLAQSNPSFNVGRFERACVPGANVRARK